MVSARLTCLGFCLRQSKTTVAAQVTERPVLMCDCPPPPRRASILINECVSLWDHCMVWGLGLHHSVNFSVTRENQNRLRGVLCLSFRAKLSCAILTFILTDSIMAAKLRESVRPASYLATQPTPFSALQQSDLSILQPSPRYSSIFSQLSSSTQYLSTGWAILLASFSQPVSFDWVRLSRYLSTEPHSVSRPWVGVPWMFHLGPPVSFLLGGDR